MAADVFAATFIGKMGIVLDVLGGCIARYANKRNYYKFKISNNKLVA